MDEKVLWKLVFRALRAGDERALRFRYLRLAEFYRRQQVMS